MKQFGALNSYSQKRWGIDDSFINGVCIDAENRFKYTKGHDFDLDKLKKILLGDVTIDEYWSTKEEPNKTMHSTTLLTATPADELEDGNVQCHALDSGCIGDSDSDSNSEIGCHSHALGEITTCHSHSICG